MIKLTMAGSVGLCVAANFQSQRTARARRAKCHFGWYLRDTRLALRWRHMVRALAVLCLAAICLRFRWLAESALLRR